jgi:hypothetical protein
VARDLPELWPASVAVDAHVQAQVLPRVGWAKSTADADGDGSPDLYREPATGGGTTWPSVSGSALLWAFGLDVKLEF